MAHRVHLDADELVNKANAIVNAEERGEVWDVTGISPQSRIRLDARVALERRTRQVVRRIQGRTKKSRGKAGKSRGKAGKSRGKAGKSRKSRK